uniref:Putative aquaporin protein AQU22 n=1 Tax=Davidia involucrata TaxID=16924 RepID=A0A5B6YMM9_DAVIN
MPSLGISLASSSLWVQEFLTEGFLTFAIVIISLGLARNIPGSSFMKTWISSVSKLSLHILGSDLTGGCMNPASVMGWAYARGDHITKEHILVYWLAPIEATLLAVWTFWLLVRPVKDENANMKAKKSD